MTENEDRYETFEFIIRERSREDGESWFDKVHDFLTENCEPVLDENGEAIDCTCGMISGGGFSGTLDGCYDHTRVSEKWATVTTEDLKRILLKVAYTGLDDEEREAFNRLKDEAYWHDNFQTWLDNLPDDEEDEEEFELDEEFKPYFSNEPLPESVERKLLLQKPILIPTELPDSIIKGDW